jgi:hypothetical protein
MYPVLPSFSQSHDHTYSKSLSKTTTNFFCSVTTFLPYGCYLGNSWCIVPPLVDPNVSVKLDSIFIEICYLAQALENTDVWIVFQYL